MTVKNHHTLKHLLSLAKAEKDTRLAVRIQVVALAKQGLTCPVIPIINRICALSFRPEGHKVARIGEIYQKQIFLRGSTLRSVSRIRFAALSLGDA